MYSVVHSDDAEEDLSDIWHYTCQTWGARQADLYIDELCAELANLASNPEIGASRGHIRPGYRALHVAHHVAYYAIKNSIIDVVRVLHERMDPTLHIDPEQSES